MQIAFHTEQFGIRGTETAVYDYADGNETILKNVSHIIAPANSDMTTFNKFSTRFGNRVFRYNHFSEVNTYCIQQKIDVIYFIKAGYNDGKLIPNIKNVVHVVFQHNEPHGDRYAYVSQWLSEKMSNGVIPFVNHIVTLPAITKSNFRDHFKIPKDAIVYGRHGGYTEFNIPFVKQAIVDSASNVKNIYFLFMNTQPFCDLPNVFFIQPTYELDLKAAFINTCDAMIHGRDRGESFGLAIAEFLHQNKPVITYETGIDRNHIEMLRDKGIYYASGKELIYILLNFKPTNYNYSSLVSEYSPQKVMKQFEEVFLK